MMTRSWAILLPAPIMGNRMQHATIRLFFMIVSEDINSQMERYKKPGTGKTSVAEDFLLIKP
jgi:hypothetical protein